VFLSRVFNFCFRSTGDVSKMTTASQWFIRLGDGGLRFAQPRNGMAVLGTVQRGMQIGALAQLDDGSYAQVNGDIIQTLNASKVRKELRNASGSPARMGSMPVTSRSVSAAAVTVVVKKRRRVVSPLGEEVSMY
jgi:hypothetical protein